MRAWVVEERFIEHGDGAKTTGGGLLMVGVGLLQRCAPQEPAGMGIYSASSHRSDDAGFGDGLLLVSVG